jgi:hypothetical protein
MEIDSYYDESSQDGSSQSASSSYYSDGRGRSRAGYRRHSSALMSSRSRSRSRTRGRGRSANRRAYDRDAEDSESDNDSQKRRSTSRPQSLQRSRRGQSDRMNELSGRRATRSSRGVEDESVYSGEEDSHHSTTSASENDRYTSGNDDYTTDGETKSNVTRMRSRVMKWLGHSNADHNDNDEESQDHRARRASEGRRKNRNSKYAKRQGGY